MTANTTRSTTQGAFYILQVDPEQRGGDLLRGSLLTPYGCSLPEAMRAIVWQTEWADPDRFIIAKPDPELPGVMVHESEDRRVVILLERGPFTTVAYSDQIKRIWQVG